MVLRKGGRRAEKGGHHDPSWETHVGDPKRADITTGAGRQMSGIENTKIRRASRPYLGDKCRELKEQRCGEGEQLGRQRQSTGSTEIR